MSASLNTVNKGNKNYWEELARKAYGSNFGIQGVDGNPGTTTFDYMNSKNAFGLSKVDNPFSKGNIKGTVGAMVEMAGSALGGLGNNLLSNGMNSDAGNMISDIGGTLGSAISTVNPLIGGIVSVGSGLIGGGINALFGTSVKQEKLDAANQGTSYLNNFNSTANSFDELEGPKTQASVQNAYKGGLFKKGWARRKNEELKQKRIDAQSSADRNLQNNIDNIKQDEINDLLRNSYAWGGFTDIPIVNTINYGLMSDYLAMKNKLANNKNNISNNYFTTPSVNTFVEGGSIYINPSYEGKLTNLKKRTGKTEAELWAEGDPKVRKMITFARNSRKWKKGIRHALGGDIQTHGGDFTTGLTSINAGGSHEENPYEGVPMGVDNEGTPNLVEEGETIFDNYVFSKRIKIDDTTKKKFHISKNSDISYADLSKKLEKENVEKPNDTISEDTLHKQLSELVLEQERQKAEQQKEVNIINQQIEAATNTSDNNKFSPGGDLKTRIADALSMNETAFDKWLNNNNFSNIQDWENILNNQAFVNAVSQQKPMLGDAITRGYDFGIMPPTRGSRNKSNIIVIRDNNGNWNPITTQEIPQGYGMNSSYGWSDIDTDYTVNYYTPTEDTPVSETKVTVPNPDKPVEEVDEIVPVIDSKADLRYAGLLGPAVGLGMMMSGVGKPDYSRYNAALNTVNQSPVLASYKPLGNYLVYKPMDIWAEQNRLNANSRATDRAIINNSSPVNTHIAGLLANEYNNQIASGELYKKALEYNDAKRASVAEFNRGTDQYNADAYTKNSIANSEIINKNRQYSAQLAAEIARQKADSEANWYNSLYGNIGGLFRGIGDLGREYADRNLINKLVASGAIPGITPENAMNAGFVKRRSKGGKINRKRGLTF